MQLGFQLEHWGKDGRVGGLELEAREVVERLKQAEGWGCDQVWVPESYFAEAFTFLSWIGANTSRLKLGTCVTPIQARTPVNCAQAALTLDRLSQGRVSVGLGVTGVNVAEGWYGQRFDKPVARTREYVSVMRMVLEGERPANPDGIFYPLPVRDATGDGKAIKSPVRPYRKDIEILLGAQGPKNIAMAAEIADGWLPALFIPEQASGFRALLEEGFARPAARRGPADFIIPAPVIVVIDDDLERAADRVRQSILYLIALMGSGDHNFQAELFSRAGFEAEVAQARALWFEGKTAEAAAAITLAMVDAVAVVGPKARIRDNLQRWTSSYATQLVVRGDFDALRTIAEIMT